MILPYFDGDMSLNEALFYALLLCICITVNTIMHHPYFLRIILMGMKMRIACSGIIYKKLFKLNFSSAENKSISGQIINMLSNDVSRIEFAPYFIAYLGI
jgi:ATP-binding cassette subfamily C (CFTR/MRP) protein 4